MGIKVVIILLLKYYIMYVRNWLCSCRRNLWCRIW